MNKTTWILILLVLLGIAGYYLFGKKEATAPSETTPTTSGEDTAKEPDQTETENNSVSSDAKVRALLEGVAINIPDLDTEVTVTDGKGTFDAGAGTEGYITMGENYTLVNNGDKKFVLTDATVNTGGSGTFNYVFAFSVDGTTLTQTDSGYIGDRIIVKDIKAVPTDSGTVDVSVTFLTRAEDEPLSAEPTLSETLNFSLDSEGALSEQDSAQ